MMCSTGSSVSGSTIDGNEVVAGGFKAISRDLEDGKKVVKGPASPASEKKEP